MNTVALNVYGQVCSFGHIYHGPLQVNGNSKFKILENAKLFSAVAASFYFPTSNVCGFPFLHIFTNTCYFPLC